MNDMQLVKSANFGVVKCDFYSDRDNREIWMTREQIGRALEYSNPQKAIDNLHIRNKDRLDKFSVTLKLRATDGKLYDTKLYSAKGVYEICRYSRQPKADAFMDWVWDIVESIRKHGAYMTPEVIERTLSDPDFIIKLATQLKEERQARIEAEKKIELDRPKVVFAEAVTASKTSILVGELAKLLRQNGIDIGQNRLFEWLRQNGYLIKRRGTDYNMPTQYSMELGLFEVKETTITHSDGHISICKTPKVTGRGQIYFINKFKEKYKTREMAN
ncbi:phage antirepressor KilAC domain-containing protein [Tepidanaerobacter syntrophicus]|uniref:Anti-repressor protein n=1 Tax=Tepidanaerobacter syntrophicus TaxID=224999 RepID=A0A0U9HC82_9FIRM|nr:phage antirepressor KilAC domain-containing protein [Tepidanaerobacter syntrophicus]GAQ24253.1 anti-repressor protein [Tepidanaerobacter syntrophicus]